MTIRDSVLAALRRADGYVSGEGLSAELDCSRVAVNNAVKALRADGYEIISSTKKGYMLGESPDRVERGELYALLSTERMETVECIDSVDSTNKRLRELADSGARDGTVLLANCQTAGRGRLGRAFVSPRDKGIYLSLLLRPRLAPRDTTALTAWTAVAARRAIKKVCGLDTGIKWVNDIVHNGRKLCGILTEMSVEGETGAINCIIVGIGINVNETAEDFPDELRDKACSIFTETGKKKRRAELAAALIDELDAIRLRFPSDGGAYLGEYSEACVTIGREVCVISGSGERAGRALAVGDDFSLRVDFGGAVESVSSGEVSVRSAGGYV